MLNSVFGLETDKAIQAQSRQDILKIVQGQLDDQNSKNSNKRVDDDRKIHARPVRPVPKKNTRQINQENQKEKKFSEIFKRNKINNIVSTFVHRLKQNSIYRDPHQYYQDLKKKHRFIKSGEVKTMYKKYKARKGLFIGQIGLTLWSLINLIQISIMVVILTFIITFHESRNQPAFTTMKIISLAIYAVDIILNFTVERFQNGKYLKNLGQISRQYVRTSFIGDFINILFFPFCIIFDVAAIQITIFFLSMIKLYINIQEFQKFEYLFINTRKKQRYYGLAKVFIANFTIGHFLSIILNLVGTIEQEQNWLISAGISQSQWYIKYLWGYYWGTTIMLTIGFGDISATNNSQTIALIFVQVFSCIMLAYNISFVGSVINSINQRQKMINEKLKIFHRMCTDNKLSNKYEKKARNFLQQQHRIQQIYQFQAQDEIIKQLPPNLQKEYLRQSNKDLFAHLGLFDCLSNRTIGKLAEIISRKTCHSQQIVITKESIQQLVIIKNGKLGLICRNNSRLDDSLVQTIQVKKNQKPKILSFNFIKNTPINYDVKSMDYGILFHLGKQKILETLRQNLMSYQIFCMYRDRDEIKLIKQSSHLCSLCCNQYHNKFECPRLHYNPLKSIVIWKKINKVNGKKHVRLSQFKRDKSKLDPMKMYKQLKKQNKHKIQLIKISNQDRKRSIKRKASFQSSLNQSVVQQKFMEHFQQIVDMDHNLVVDSLGLDIAQNFKHYFRESNPANLRKRKINIRHVQQINRNKRT